MNNNSWFKKERPLLGLLGTGGGVAQGGGVAAPPGHTATGGTINDFTAPDGTVYRTHIFFNSGTFQVTALSPGNPAEVEVLAVGGGGAGGVIKNSNYGGGGGGAGGVVTNAADNPLKVSIPAPISVASYSVTVGGGGMIPSGIGKNNTDFSKGHNSEAPTLCPIVAQGGGGGTNSGDTTSYTGGSGGSGGGGGDSAPTRGAGNTPPYSPVQGYPGGSLDPDSPYTGGGGGGAAEAGWPGDPGNNASHWGKGGTGRQVAFAGPPTASPIGTPGPAGNGYFGGGGGGSSDYIDDPRAGGAGGGGAGGVRNESPHWPIPSADGMGVQGTGGGGGSWNNDYSGFATSGVSDGYSVGGSGIYAIRYEISSDELLTAKATGGAITFDTTNGKTIHAFTQTGTFAAPPTFSETCEYVVVGGGGGGGNTQQWGSHGGGGGGAGGYRTDSKSVTGPLSMAMTVGSGGGCVINKNGIPGIPSSIAFPAPLGGTYTAAGGGGGGGSAPPHQGGSGGSGGGSAYTGNPGGVGNSPSTTPPQGYPGNTMQPHGGGAGGGGAGSTGGPAGPGNSNGGYGGAGIALPTTFINSNVKAQFGAAGPGTPYGWVAGGGAGGPGGATDYNPAIGGAGGNAPQAPGLPWAGGGRGDGTYSPTTAPGPPKIGWPLNSPIVDGKAATGGGGGGGNGADSPNPDPTAWDPAMESRSGRGGSGLILIAYPT